jgi:hypothetical protein
MISVLQWQLLARYLGYDCRSALSLARDKNMSTTLNLTCEPAVMSKGILLQYLEGDTQQQGRVKAPSTVKDVTALSSC